MNYIIEQINLLRKHRPYEIDLSNSNKYRVVANESDGSQTAYYFSSPIYNMKDKRLFDGKFTCKNGEYIHTGSNAEISIARNIVMKNYLGECKIPLEREVNKLSDMAIINGEIEIRPTVNGILLSFPLTHGNTKTLTLNVDCNIFNLRTNNKSFSVMVEKFRPLATVSCVGVLGNNNEIIAPLEITLASEKNKNYTLLFSHNCLAGKKALLEINMHDQKLFQDTTVESGHANENNAFGGTAFLGQTDTFGTQWLYSRPDFSVIPEIMSNRINSIYFHIPKLNRNEVPLIALSAVVRFCSFGSTWENKVPALEDLTNSVISEYYHTFDVTDFLRDEYSKHLKITAGMIIKPSTKDNSFSVISTADSSCIPQILEINYIP